MVEFFGGAEGVSVQASVHGHGESDKGNRDSIVGGPNGSKMLMCMSR